ncbi:MAG: SEC-C metal-binding domain-containing protein [Acidobacteriota bacterium]|nr:SEC-C metal-binding domain-containing protein [Acidobacteriota bacterium]
MRRIRSCQTRTTEATIPFTPSSKRRRGYPSETRVKRGLRVVHGDKELQEKLGRNDLCPCGSGRRFQTLLPANRSLRRSAPA